MKSALITCIFIGASFLQMRADPVAGSQTDLRDGFYLLHHDCKEESQASMITWIKTTPPQVVDYIKRVSQLAKESVQILDQMADKDPGLRGEADPLPPFSQAVRTSLSDDKEHLLLFGSKGTLFARRFLFTQAQACNYITHLTKVWSERDRDTFRAAEMRKLFVQWRAMRDEAFRLNDAL
jgi:hypothetical protein